MERESLIGRYYGMGPGRDRAKSIAAYEGILRRGDTLSPVLINLGEQLRSRREYARAESLNIIAARLNPGSGTALGNAVELQLNQGKFKDAAATSARLKAVSVPYALGRTFSLALLQGDDRALRPIADSLLRRGSPVRVVVFGDDEDSRLGPCRSNSPCRLDPTEPRHPQVHERPVGLLDGVRRNRLITVSTLHDFVRHV